MAKLFGFSGRASRLEYWRMIMQTTALSAVVMVATVFAITQFGRGGGVLMLGFVPLLAMAITVGLRRAHDRGKGAVWFWAVILGPFACEVAAYNLAVPRGMTLVMLALGLAALGLSLWGWVELGFLRGKPSPNAYGAAPAR